MGRTEPSVGRPPASVRRDARAKQARATLNKVIPAMLAAHPRARRGVDASELIVDPPPAPAPAGNGAGDGPQDCEDQGSVGAAPRPGPRVSLRVADTLAAAYELLLVGAPPGASNGPAGQTGGEEDAGREGRPQRRDLANTSARVAVLNMASPLGGGGGFRSGATAQEESLCARTALLPALRDEFYRLPELGVVFTPDVLVFRGGDGAALPKPRRWFVDVASAAMLRMPEVAADAATGRAAYAAPADRDLAARKMRAVLRVLGAWGCGAYGNPVAEIARAWRRVLRPGGTADAEGDVGREEEQSAGKQKGKHRGRARAKTRDDAGAWGAIEHVVFAIQDARMARAFAAAFGPALLDPCDVRPGPPACSPRASSEDEGEGGAEVAELRAKVRELELRVAAAPTPQLRAGLAAVLAGLRSQLPASRDGDDEGDGEAAEGGEGSGEEESVSNEDGEGGRAGGSR
ncbi:hypothetical protein GGS23DRAFT_611482 [Durotheca rogersii]|uniref:uncharacterized protein n=1 Tax=Durotheca rogersii TaxID=419775 RepID=UPI002220E5A6|nr:uncharacterized protein GGS23DRAFT_611482 [Durotheca rogersii]KAI5861494.1 hypothetical protein GGS23DRAFT_611482 [Durotheca rogersii]